MKTIPIHAYKLMWEILKDDLPNMTVDEDMVSLSDLQKYMEEFEEGEKE